eukprot:5996145-Lingulodinium_polyedra.AAC.1
MSAASAAASPQFYALLNARAPLRRRSGGGSLPRPWCPPPHPRPPMILRGWRPDISRFPGGGGDLPWQPPPS